MTAVWLRLRSDLRSRWRAWVGLSLIVGFSAGAAMALAQAARRSEHAYRSFSDRSDAADVVMTGFSTFGLVGGVDLDRVERSGYVERTARGFVGLPFSGRTDRGQPLDAGSLFPVAARDGKLGRSIERWKLLAGRRARPTEVGEATASFVLAERLHLHVGSRIDLRFYRADAFGSVGIKLLTTLSAHVKQRHNEGAAPDYADGPRVRFTVVGIEASPAEFPPLITDLSPVLHLTPAFARRYEREIVGSPLAYVKLRRSRDLKSFQLEVERLAAGRPVSFVATRANQDPKVQRSIHAEALALAIVAALVALAGIVGVGQAMARQTLAESGQLSILHALGMRDAQLRAIELARLLGIGVTGVALGAAVAVFGSQYALLPLASKAELDPGAHVDATVLGVGAFVVIGLALVIAFWASHVAIRNVRRPPVRPSAARSKRVRLATGGAVGTLWISAMFGIRFALQRAARAVPAWATILAAGLTVAVMAGALTFSANLHRLLSDAHRYGWNWDVKIGPPGLPDFAGSFVPSLQHDPSVTALSSGTVTQIDVGRARIDVLAVDRLKGAALPTLLAGRAPSLPDEIALGARTMRVLGVQIGESIDARIGRRTQRLRVVGQPVLPEFGDAGQLGTGSVMTLQGLRRLLPEAPVNSFLIRFVAARDPDKEGQLLARAVEPIPADFQARPDDLVELARGGGLLLALVGLLTILAFVLLAHALVTAVRSRRHDFAVLRALGARRTQLRAIVVWQVLTLMAGAVAFGLLIGSALGRLAWKTFAQRLGVASDAIVSPGALALVAAGALCVALLAAVVPASIAARTRSTQALRAE